MSEFVVPKDPKEAYALCISTLERLHTCADEAMESVRASCASKETLTREQTSEFNRVCSMARHATYCLVASRWNVHGRSERKRKLQSLGIDPSLWDAKPKKGSRK